MSIPPLPCPQQPVANCSPQPAGEENSFSLKMAFPSPFPDWIVSWICWRTAFANYLQTTVQPGLPTVEVVWRGREVKSKGYAVRQTLFEFWLCRFLPMAHWASCLPSLDLSEGDMKLEHVQCSSQCLAHSRCSFNASHCIVVYLWYVTCDGDTWNRVLSSLRLGNARTRILEGS